jgi:hypothetical protein
MRDDLPGSAGVRGALQRSSEICRPLSSFAAAFRDL